MIKSIKKFLMLITVAVLALLMGLIFFGTLAQRTHGIWWVMDQYFTSLYVMVPLEIFAPTGKTIPGSFPYPGGATLGVLLLVLLLISHTLTFKLKARGWRLAIGLVIFANGIFAIFAFQSWGVILPIKTAVGVAGMLMVGAVVYTPAVAGTWLLFGSRVGIVLIHASLVLLIVGEGVTRTFALETQMPIFVGESSNWTHDIRESELVVIAPIKADDTTERVTAIPQHLVEEASITGQPITHDAFPFSITVEQFMINSTFAGYPRGMSPPQDAKGLAQRMVLMPQPRATGVGQSMVDLPGAWLVLHDKGGQVLGRYAVSTITANMGDPFVTIRQNVDVDGEPWLIDFRFRRYYHDYRFELAKFNHDVYPGTQIPLNFASDIVIHEPDTTTGRHVTIRMNQPLRYAGNTFFQSSYIPDRDTGGSDLGTVLQVVRNPGSTMPYIACALGGVGLLIHFVISLWKYLRKSLKQAEVKP